jgi:hypothetical protein
MIDLTEEEMKIFNSWTKEQIYEAYLSENITRKKLNKEVNDLKRKIISIRYSINRVMEDAKV